MRVSRRADHTRRLFLRRTVAAQIHLFSVFLVIAGVGGLLFLSRGLDRSHQAAILAFGVTASLVFVISATYHFLHDGFESSPELSARLEELDQSAIYLFIAGTYSPLILNVLGPESRRFMLISVWGVALIGIVMTIFRPYLWKWLQHRAVYTGGFVVMGWLLLFRIGEVLHNISRPSLIFLLAGAACYSVGALVYATRRPRLLAGFFGYHELWHVLVTCGFLCHFGMVASFYRA